MILTSEGNFAFIKAHAKEKMHGFENTGNRLVIFKVHLKNKANQLRLH